MSASTDGTNYNPVAFSGFNADVVVEASVPAPLLPMRTATTVTMDGGTNNTGNSWYEQGYYQAMPTSGLPPAGSTLTSVSLPDHHYVMPASYTNLNAIYVDAGHPIINVTPATPAWYSGLSFLSATANGVVTNQVIIQYSDGTSDTNKFVSQDWFNGNPYAYDAYGRVSTDNRCINNDRGHGGSNPRLYEAQFALRGAADLANTNYTITNVIVTFVGAANPTSGRMVALAVSGTAGSVAPVIALQPTGLTTVEGSNVVLSVIMGGGTPPFSYQWQVGTNNVWANVTDTPLITGSTTTALSFTPIGLTNTADYRFVANGAGGNSTSAVAHITVYSGLPDIPAAGDPITAFGATTGDAGAPGNIDHLVGGTPDVKCLWNANVNVGFIVTPSMGASIARGLRLFWANDTDGRDPASVILEGSNDGGTTWMSILPLTGVTHNTARNAAASVAPNPLTQAMQEFDFYANNAAYTSYRVTFPTNYAPASNPLTQIGEVQILGVPAPVAPWFVVQPPANVKVFVGASPTFGVLVKGYPTNFTYQWYLDATNAIPNATNASYTFSNARVADSGKTFSCTVANSVGTTNSTSATLTVVAAPSGVYATTIMAAQPLAYFRLDEGPDDGSGNNGVVANDSWGGHAGVYTNVILSVPGYSTSDPDTAAKFGFVGNFLTNYVGGIQGIDFSTPTNQSVAFSIETWVQGQAQQYDAGIVTKGAGGGGEQFALDTGATGAGAHGFRFYVRDVSGAVHSANTGTNAIDSNWHHLVGVVDEANSNVTLYVDGIVSSVASISPSNGLLRSTHPISIGAREQNASSGYNLQFYGTIDEVAIYNYALSSTQVLSHFYAAGIAPIFTVVPTNSTYGVGSTGTFYSLAYGSPTLGYQWYQSTDGGASFAALAAATNADLGLPNLTQGMYGYLYEVVATNLYGAATSGPVSLAVIGGPPFAIADVPPQTMTYAGRSFSLPVQYGGDNPLSYAWSKDGVPLSDNLRITGSHSNVLTVLNSQVSDTGNYQVTVSNGQGTTPSAIGAVFVESVPRFNTNGIGWTLNGTANIGAPIITDDVLPLTTSLGGSARSAFYNFPLYIGAFKASFTYQDVGGFGADGAAFVVQNDTRGPLALGGGGGGLGYSGIAPSAALEFNIYTGNTPGIALRANGATGAPYQGTDPVNIASGDVFNVSLLYVSGVMQVTLKDVTLGLSYSTTLSADLPTILGANTAYVGMTGADGGTASTQNVSNFQFTPLPTLMAQPTGTNTVILSWPASIGGYALQSRSDVATGTWQPVSAPVTQSGGYNQVNITPTGNQFYRLTLQ